MPNSKRNHFAKGGKMAVNIKRECYTMATLDGDEAEIVMYGEIVESRPRSWWSGEEIPGDYIVGSEFLDDLKEIEGASKITIRINSVGGNAYTSIMIHNRLREMKGKVTAIVDGVAMSGGSLIMCAADTVQVNPSSMIMIHKCLSFLYGYYNSEELEKAITSNNSVDKAQAAIYRRKTGISEEDVLALMGEETYMTGEEAVSKGFADELLDTEGLEIAASADCRTVYVNGKATKFGMPFMNLPDSIPTVKAAEDAVEINKNQPAQTGSNKGGKTMARTLEELRAENPELANSLMAEAQAAASAESVTAERQRMQEIDEISALYSAEMVHEAKYGANPCSAQELAFRAAQEAAKKGGTFVSGMNADAQASNTDDVSALPGADDGTPKSEEDMTPEERMASARSEVKALFKKKED